MTIRTELSGLTGEYVLDTSRTRIGFVARHTIATKVNGRFDVVQGRARLDGDNPAKSTVDLTIEAKTIQTRNQRRDEPLRRKFLDVDRYPTIAFTSTAVTRFDQTHFHVKGDLTIRGVTKPVTVDIELTGVDNGSTGKTRVRFAGSAMINRKAWGVEWKAAIGLVSKTVNLEFDVVMVRS
jgi:polyisoprenoid-binding protein YceI